MRFLVFSDVHGNLTALEAALDAAEGRWQRAVCLGDLVGYGPDPNEVVDRVRRVAATVIRGNHDRAACGIDNLDDFNPAARMAIEWTRAQLQPGTMTYLQGLPAGPVQIEGLTLVHGALHDEDEYIFAPMQALDTLLSAPSQVTFFGHTHFQGGFSQRGELVDMIQPKTRAGENFSALRIEPGTRYLLNPGSIGQPRDGDPRAAFAIADLDHGVVEFWRVAYDIAAVQARMMRVGAPEPLVLRLAAGR